MTPIDPVVDEVEEARRIVQRVNGGEPLPSYVVRFAAKVVEQANALKQLTAVAESIIECKHDSADGLIRPKKAHQGLAYEDQLWHCKACGAVYRNDAMDGGLYRTVVVSPSPLAAALSQKEG